MLTWAENSAIFGDIGFAFQVTFLNKCTIGTPHRGRVYQRCLGEVCHNGGCSGRQLGQKTMNEREPIEEFKRLDADHGSIAEKSNSP